MSTAVPSAQVDRELVVQLRLAVMRLARRLRQQTLGEITASQLSALSSLNRLGPLTLGALAAVERVRPPTMTRIVGHLEAAGLVVRRPAPTDRRSAEVELSPSGRELLDRSRTRKDAYLAERLATLEPAEVAVLRRAAVVLERLLEADERR
ncbi:MAG TPA: MarR family transcriptional regulator [Actinomycetota bacterium]|nr:MarR family transcriptional regulator [Actinomycetota bacterium]